MPFLAVVEFGSDDRGITGIGGGSITMMLARYAAHCRGNIDSFLINVIRWCNKNNIDLSQSMFLRQYAKGNDDAAKGSNL